MVKLEFELRFILFQIAKIWFRKAEMGRADIYKFATLVEQKLAYFEFEIFSALLPFIFLSFSGPLSIFFSLFFLFFLPLTFLFASS